MIDSYELYFAARRERARMIGNLVAAALEIAAAAAWRTAGGLFDRLRRSTPPLRLKAQARSDAV